MSKKKLAIIGIVLLMLFFISPIGIAFSRYVTQNIRNYIMEANNFFFNSDKLAYGGTTYGINNWGGVGAIEIQFQLNNHKNNILTSDADIVYSLTTTCDTTSVNCTLNANSGVIQRAEKTDNLTLTVNPRRVFNDNESTSVTVTATSSSPYVKTLSATFVITVGTRGINYEITDSVGSAYMVFKITNAQDTYKVITPFGNHTAGEVLTTSEYLALSSADKANCASALVTLTFDPSEVILDTTSDIMKTATYTTTRYNNIDYISTITFKVDVMTSMDIRFYKKDSTENYTYPFVTNTPIVSFSAI
jgi:hypothetical protein